jgi:hypothetical protein
MNEQYYITQFKRWCRLVKVTQPARILLEVWIARFHPKLSDELANKIWEGLQ